MQKVYTVLKNNKKEGPYRLQELQQLSLKQTDLIWVEGRSTAWSYPSEIKELQSFNPGVNTSIDQQSDYIVIKKAPNVPVTTGAKKIFVGLPCGIDKKLETRDATQATSIEEKAEALRQRILNQPSPKPALHDELVETRLKRSMDDVAGDFANWAIHQKSKKRKINLGKKELLVLLVTLVVFVGIYMMLPQSTTQKTSSGIKEDLQSVQPLAAENSNADVGIEFSIGETTEHKKEIEKPKPNAIDENKNIQKEKAEERIVNKNVQPQPSVSETFEPAVKEVLQETVAIKEPEKKKSIGEALDGFFDKFKNKKKEPASGTASTNDGERKSTKRNEEAAAEPATVDVTSQVKVTSSAARDNWMLGIKGQKLTFQNNSKAVITSAWVTIEYYGENDALLDTKKIEFKNIKPAQKVLQPIPDHRLASYTTQQVMTATGILQ